MRIYRSMAAGRSAAPRPVGGVARRPVRRLRGVMVAGLLGIGLLAGCAEAPQGDDSLGFVSSGQKSGGSGVAAVGLVGGNVVVKGPRGYCVERDSIRNGDGSAFAMLARCDLLSGLSSSRAALGVLTVTIAPFEGADLPDVQELARDFGSGSVIEVAQRSDVRMLHLASGGDRLVEAADPRQWRGAFLINGHVVSMAAYGPQQGSVAGRGGLKLMLDLAEAIRKASPRNATPPVD
ncbi:hypothetical protein [Pseudooceanicola algae]|nr:hypothetical protein [Pseudooceanicola algae]